MRRSIRTMGVGDEAAVSCARDLCRTCPAAPHRHRKPATRSVRSRCLTQPQAAAPQEYQAAQIIADAWRKLGLTVNVRPLPGQQFNQVIWYERQRWDATTWQMVGRPERSDPDELTYNLFVSANAANGYDFVGYKNPEYDKLAQAAARGARPRQAQGADHAGAGADQPRPALRLRGASLQRCCLQQDGLGSEEPDLAGRHRHPQHLDLAQHQAARRAEGRGPELGGAAHQPQPVQHLRAAKARGQRRSSGTG